MRFLLATAVVAMAGTGAASAADFLPTPSLLVDTTVFEAASNGFDGPYAGVSIGGVVFSAPTVYEGQIAGIVGMNFVADQFLAGIEGNIYGFYNDTPAYGAGATVSGRVGLVATPEAVVYLVGSSELRTNGNWYVGLGGGAEFMVADDMSIDLRYRYLGWSNSGFTGHTLSAALLWHF